MREIVENTSNDELSAAEGNKYRGDLLLVSNFLTSFRRCYSWNDEELDDGDLGFVITPAEIESALTLRYLLECKANLRDLLQGVKDAEARVARIRNPLAPKGDGKVRVRIEDFLADVEAELKERAKDERRHQRDLHVHEMLERFEVWSSKDLAHAAIMPPARCGCRNEEEAKRKCWTKLLHLPSASFFADRVQSEGLAPRQSIFGQQNVSDAEETNNQFSNLFHKAYNDPAGHAMCCSILSPNHHTWEEYAMIGEMVSNLSEIDQQKAADSPCCGTVKTMQSYGAGSNPNSPRRGNFYSQDYDFQTHDLVALWVRAQRDSGAMRHLIQLFGRPTAQEITEWAVAKLGDASPNPAELEHDVVFRGNHKETKKRVVQETPQVQDLVAWAVTNQVLFQQNSIQGRLQKISADAASQAALTRKRTCTTFERSQPSKKAKKKRSEHPVKTEPTEGDNDIEAKLLRNCQSHLLRLFGRKHEAILKIMYKQTPAFLPSRLYYDDEQNRLYQQCKEAGISDAVQSLLRTGSNQGRQKVSSDLLFSRIDRRIRRSHSGISERGRASPFYKMVIDLLRAFAEKVAENDSIKVDPNLLKSVVDDFDGLYNEFHEILEEKGCLSAAKSLLEIDTDGVDKDLILAEDLNEDNATRLSQFLLVQSAPWNETCGVCAKRHKRNPDLTICCANCETAYHEECYSPSNFCKIACKDLLTQLPNSSLLHAELPENDLMPGFSSGKPSSWTKHSLILRREVGENGRFMPIGLDLRQTADARESYYFCTNSLSLESLYDTDPQRDLMEQFPLNLCDTIEGCIVSNVHEAGAGHKAGFIRNDVIIGLQYVSFLEGTQASSTETIHWFGSLTKESRLKLFAATADVLKLVVLRPDTDLISRSRAWIESIRALNRCSWELLTGSTLYFCDACKKKGEQALPDDETQRVVREAKQCRAVIRRLAGFSNLFHYEDTENCGLDGCVSLARLDAMMNYIIHDNLPVDQRNAEKMESWKNAFFEPPWISCSGSERKNRPRLSTSRERLHWAPQESEKMPKEILFKGVGFLVRQQRKVCDRPQGLPTFPDEKKALLRQFLKLLFSWCVPIGDIPSKVLPRSALYAPLPFPDACSICQARPCEKSRSGHYVCDSRHCLRALNKAQLGKDILANYNENSSLIGTTVLVFPNDPWLDYVAQRESLTITTHDRPVEFLVAFYVPPLEGQGGQFLLLPIISEHQLQFLLDRCPLLQPKKLPPSLTLKSLEQWMRGSALGLDGVVRCSRSELNTKMIETAKFFSKIQKFLETCSESKLARPPSGVASLLQRREHTLPKQVRLIGPDLPTMVPERLKRFLLSSIDSYTRLIESIIRMPTPLAKQFLETWRLPDSTSTDDPDLDLASHSAKVDVSENPVSADLEKLTRDSLHNPQPPRGYHFSVLYTDLYYTSPEEKNDIIAALRHEHIDLPEKIHIDDHTCEKIIVLRRPSQPAAGLSSVPEYNGIGWGFELICWKDDGLMRVGRVHPASPASRAGLRMHDVILSINGRAVGQDMHWTSPLIVCSILSSPLCVRKARHRGDVIVSALKIIGTKGLVQGPVVLKVHRPKRKENAASLRVPSQLLPERSVGQTTSNQTVATMAVASVPPVPTDHSTTIRDHALHSARSTQSHNIPSMAVTTSPLVPTVHGAQTSSQDHGQHSAGQNPSHQTLAAMASPLVSAAHGAQTSVQDNLQHSAGQTHTQELRASVVSAQSQLVPRDHRAPAPSQLQQDFEPRNPNDHETPIALRRRNNDAQVCGVELLRGDAPQENVGRIVQSPRSFAVAPVDNQHHHHDRSNQGPPQNVPELPIPVQAQGAVGLAESAGLSQVHPPVMTDEIAIAYASRDLIPALKKIVTAIKPRRRPLKNRHLYMALGMNTVLTKVETAVYFEALENDFPLLGIRLLCPRYTVPVIVANLKKLLMNNDMQDLDQVPLLQDHVWKQLLVKDYKRFKDEPSNATRIFVDKSGSYGFPTARLPLDRTVEEIISGAASEQNSGQGQHEQVQGGGQQGRNGNMNPAWIHQSAQQVRQQNEGFYSHPQPASASPRNYHGYYPPGAGNYQMPHPHQPPMNFVPPAHQGFAVPRGQLQHHDASSGANGTDLERIRGGGPSQIEAEKGRPLLEFRLKDWHGKICSFEAESERDGIRSEALFLGTVQFDIEDADKTSIESIDEVIVACIFCSTVGVFDTKKLIPVDVEDLFVVSEGTKNYHLYKEAAAQFKHEGDNMEHMGHQNHQQGRPQSFESPRMDTEQLEGDAETEKLSFQLACIFLRKDGVNKPLGTLPDGRLVQWFPNDPLALYVQSDSGVHSQTRKEFQEAFLACVSRANKDRTAKNEKLCTGVDPYCCLFGCAWAAKDPNSPLRLAEFQNEGMLARHNAKLHSYRSSRSEGFYSVNEQLFVRVGDWQTLQMVLCDLTSSACALSAKVAEKARTDKPAIVVDDPSGQRLLSSPSRYFCSLPLDDLIIIVDDARSENEHQLLKVVSLLSKLRLLFRQDGAGIGLSPGALRALGLNKQRQDRNPEPLQYRKLCTCSDESPRDDTQESCTLCALPTEGNILKSNRALRQNTPFHQPQFHQPQGIGCKLPSSMLLPGSRAAPPQTPAFGKFGFCKMLLTRIFATLPSQLHACQPKDVHDPIGNVKDVWKQDGRRFKIFLDDMSSVRAIAQAVVVLVCALDHPRLPRWWRQSEFGWLHSAQTLLLQPSLAKLTLHLLVLDVAIAEFTLTGSKTRPLPNLKWSVGKESVSKRFAGLSVRKRMQLLLQIAFDNGIARFQGMHGYFCCVCDDGGDLICCEFCSSVIHAGCCSPRLSAESIDSWVCTACSVDILEISNQEKSMCSISYCSY